MQLEKIVKGYKKGLCLARENLEYLNAGIVFLLETSQKEDHYVRERDRVIERIAFYEKEATYWTRKLAAADTANAPAPAESAPSATSPVERS